ncbi:MAG: beta-N-acetylhexosaminidase [Pseudomonadales bacterium]|nr:beta-N-acetylhexosaminidase [Pseudomonadales bacterium]
MPEDCSPLSTLGPLMMDVEGLVLTVQDSALIQHPFVGGLILFSRNYESVEQIRALITSIRELRPELIIAVDQEGGRVQRFKSPLTRLPPLKSVGKLYESDPLLASVYATELGWLMASEILALGVDISFAPVLDLAYGVSSIIGDRALHSKPEVASLLGGAYIEGMSQAGMAATGKHFPGHGAVQADSHLELPIDSRSLEEITQHDIIPFRNLAAQLGGVMPAHIVYEKIDSLPAGFSSYWLQTILREELGFCGVIFSDDLSMAGAAMAGTYAQRADKALAAGCDMILVCNCREGVNALLSNEQIIKHEADQSRIHGLKGCAQVSGLDELRSLQRYQAAKKMIIDYS